MTKIDFYSHKLFHNFKTWDLIAVRQEFKIIDNSEVVHELELAIKR